MEDSFEQKAKKCCSLENKRLMKHLSRCDSEFPSGTLRHRCYRVAARRSGQRSRKCMIEA